MMESVFVLSGEVDAGTGAANHDDAEEFWTSAEGPVWVVDLAEVSFMDSTGLGLLVQIHSRAVAGGAAVVLRNASTRVIRLLGMTGLAQLFAFDPPIGPYRGP